MGPALRRRAALLERRPWLAYLVLTALAFPITEMIVAGERATQYAHDVFDDDVPRLFSIAADWRAFGPSLWDTHLTSGNALLAQFALPPTAPDVLLSFVLTPFAAFALNTALMSFAAGVAMHLFLRDSLRLATIACFAGGILATFAFWHYIYGYAALLLPLVLWTTDRALDGSSPGRGRWLGAIAVVWFLFLSSQVQIVVLDGAVALAYVVLASRDGRPWTARVTRLAGIWVAAAILAAPVLATLILALPDSQRSIWVVAEVSFPQAIADAARRYAAVLFGVRTAGLGGSADIYGSYFAGALALPFLALSLVLPRLTPRLRFALLLLVAIPVADVLASAVAHAQTAIPIIGSFQFVRVRHLMPVAVAVNVAIGVSWVLSDRMLRSLRVRRRAMAVAVVSIALAAVALQAVVGVRHVLRPSVSARLQSGWDLSAIALVGGLLAAGAILVLAAIAWRRGWATGRAPVALGLILLVGLAGERFVFSRAERNLDGLLGSWAAEVAPTSAQAFIASQGRAGRVLSIGERPNRVLSLGLDAVDGYQVVYPLRYHELFGALTAPHLAVDPVKDAYFHEWGNKAYAFGPEIDRPIADLLGVRWLYVRGSTLDDPTLPQRFSEGNVTVYENPDAFPRAFIVHSAEVVADRPALVATLGQASASDLRSRIYLAAADATDAARALDGSPAEPSPGDTAQIQTDTPDLVTIRTHAGAPGILVLADTFDAGWTAAVDGDATAIMPADDALRGVAIPAGDHLVTFAYRPIPTFVGAVVALLTALALAAWALLPRLRSGRRPATARSAPGRAVRGS